VEASGSRGRKANVGDGGHEPLVTPTLGVFVLPAPSWLLVVLVPLVLVPLVPLELVELVEPVEPDVVPVEVVDCDCTPVVAAAVWLPESVFDTR
jgi:hypothetical protein